MRIITLLSALIGIVMATLFIAVGISGPGTPRDWWPVAILLAALGVVNLYHYFKEQTEPRVVCLHGRPVRYQSWTGVWSEGKFFGWADDDGRTVRILKPDGSFTMTDYKSIVWMDEVESDSAEKVFTRISKSEAKTPPKPSPPIFPKDRIEPRF